MVTHTVTTETVKYCSPGVFSYTVFFYSVFIQALLSLIYTQALEKVGAEFPTFSRAYRYIEAMSITLCAMHSFMHAHACL